MNYYETRAQASRDINEWLVNGSQDWSTMQKRLLLRYGFSKTLTNKIKEELQ